MFLPKWWLSKACHKTWLVKNENHADSANLPSRTNYLFKEHLIKKNNLLKKKKKSDTNIVQESDVIHFAPTAVCIVMCLLAQLQKNLATAQPIWPNQPEGTIISLSPVTVAGPLMTNCNARGGGQGSSPSLVMHLKHRLHNQHDLSSTVCPPSCTGCMHVCVHID